jgi:predicted transcriptional regulator
MNFSIYLKDELVEKLQRIAEQEQVSRNNLITEAIENLVNERSASTWGEEVLNWQGYSDFELGSNDDLIPPKEFIL